MKNLSIIIFHAIQIEYDYFIFFIPNFTIFKMCLKIKYFVSGFSYKIVDSVILNFNLIHACSSSYIKNLNIIILRTMNIAYDYFILFLFPILPYFCFI